AAHETVVGESGVSPAREYAPFPFRRPARRCRRAGRQGRTASHHPGPRFRHRGRSRVRTGRKRASHHRPAGLRGGWRGSARGSSIRNPGKTVMPSLSQLRRIRPRQGALGLALAALFLSPACTVGPDYKRPAAPVPAAYKENANWPAAQPSDSTLRGKWWEVFGDQSLNALDEQVTVSNQTLKAAQAQFLQARAAVRFSRAAFFPVLTVSPAAARSRESGTQPFAGPFSKGVTANDFTIPFDASYEADVWGRVRRTVEAARAGAQASAADVETVSLSLHAELALDYFQAHSLDAEMQLLNSTVSSYTKALELTESRYKGGVASQVDVAQAKTQLETTRAQAIDLLVARAQLEHAIAALIGKPASEFTLPVVALSERPPAIPLGLPSQLLERRPDVAGAERHMAAANANIGIARSAYFPAINLGVTGGFNSAMITTLIQGPSSFWSVGAAAVETLFEGGQRRAVSEQARAA